uniref:Nitrate regulatory gene2 protein n=1 Tax=Ananas comosus var. bracteatus TaxID=296719 RepID=A0A6V7P198_ANACO|nr:unnamed protein product [Ananas comosus var. bracteatus]
MGCGSSRAEESAAAVLCRDRARLIRAARDRRYALAAAHAAYFRSLSAMGDALSRFVAEELTEVASSSSAPTLTLPPSQGKPRSMSKSNSKPSSASSNGRGGLSVSSSVTPLSHALSITEGSRSHISSSLVSSPRKARKEMPSPLHSPSLLLLLLVDRRFQTLKTTKSAPAPASAPPSTPPPPALEVSAWDFFDPFTSYDQFVADYAQGRYGFSSYSSSPNSSAVREKEGIPELETEMEVEKEKRVVDARVSVESTQEKDSKVDMEERDSKSSLTSIEDRSSGEDEGSNEKKKGVTFGEDKSLDFESGESNEKSISTFSSSGVVLSVHGTRDIMEAVREITEQFEFASDCGEEVSRMLEVGKAQYRMRSRILTFIFSRILDPMALTILSFPRLSFKQFGPSSASSSTTSNYEPEKYTGMKSGNLSSTLEKLYLWEKKLCKEVKDEEKLRLIYEKKYNQLMSLDKGGAEFYEIDYTRAMMQKLCTKIGVIVKSIDAISARMQQIRDEELQPQLAELIQGSIRMWVYVLDCHQKQLQAIIDSKSHHLKAKAGGERSSVARATMELEFQLRNWCHCFINWFKTQKSYIEVLNKWLIKWLPKVQEEETPDGVPPFSPSKLGAPPAFIICNDWSQAIERISENNVVNAMNVFSSFMHQLRVSQEEEYRRKLKVDYLSMVYDKRLKSFEKETHFKENLNVVSVSENGTEYLDDHTMVLDSVRKRRDEEIEKHEEAIQRVHHAASSSLRSGLVPIFEALENFFMENLKAYEGIRIANESGDS